MTDIDTDQKKTDLELLGLLQEECAEVTQVASKIRRFGIESYSPFDPKQKTNRTLLEDELGDLLLIQKLLEETGLIDHDRIVARMEWKRTKLLENGYIPPWMKGAHNED